MLRLCGCREQWAGRKWCGAKRQQLRHLQAAAGALPTTASPALGGTHPGLKMPCPT